MIYESQLTAFRKYVADSFISGTPTFPHYTLHGEEHLAELDRLTLMLAKKISKLDEDDANLLRLAVIMHDFAMVAAPNAQREAELRSQMSPDMSFADVVRQTHQDEIEQCFSEQDRCNHLTRNFPNLSLSEINNACIIAKHHRYHPLENAPDHLRHLCALMRLVDELDIGPKRAPRPTYEALRESMDDISKLHWIKHLCTLPLEMHKTVTIEERRKELTTFLVWVAVEHGNDTWVYLQDLVSKKINNCLENEGVNQVLREKLSIEIKVEKGPEQLCVKNNFFPTFLNKDLEQLAESKKYLAWKNNGGSENSGNQQTDNDPDKQPFPVPLACETEADLHSPNLRGTSSSVAEQSKFRIIAIPPEELMQFLSTSSRLSVIDNKYVPQAETNIAGCTNAPSRIYVGPADCGKTRAAAEWINKLTNSRPGSWVILRSDFGTIPDKVENIVLDTSRYGDCHHTLPQKAILFMDDLPANLPTVDATTTATDAIRTLFRWLQNTPYFRERRVVGTIRTEDMHARPDWPGVLPSLGHDLELVQLQHHTKEQYRALWEGMNSGTIHLSESKGARKFEIEISRDFLNTIAEYEATPEAVATFMFDAVNKTKTCLDKNDAESFSDSAVQTWLDDVWPTIFDTYGVSARVFYTLSRFVEGGLRSNSEFGTSLKPLWDFHSIYGPAMLKLHGVEKENYLDTIIKMEQDGHAIGKQKEWIRPRWDYILQADKIPNVEFELPNFDWFVKHSQNLEYDTRISIATHLSAAKFAEPINYSLDDAWLIGFGRGRLILTESYKEEIRVVEWREQAIDAFRKAIEINPNNDKAWDNLGSSLGNKSNLEKDIKQKALLLEQATEAFRKAIEINPNNDKAWDNLGSSLGNKSNLEKDIKQKALLLEQATEARRKAIKINPNNDNAWENFGNSLHKNSDLKKDVKQKASLLEQATEAFRKAIEINPNNDSAMSDLGASLFKKSDLEKDIKQKSLLLDQAIEACRKAIKINPNNDHASNNFGASLFKKSYLEKDIKRKSLLLDQAIEACRKAIKINPNNNGAWDNLGTLLCTKTDLKKDVKQKALLLQQSTEACRKAIEINPNNNMSWYNLGGSLAKSFHLNQRQALLPEILETAKKAVTLGSGRYNLACALALNNLTAEALEELEKCIKEGEITRQQVCDDPDWANLYTNSRFREISGYADPDDT